MDLIKEHNKRFEFFREITGVAMKVYNKYKSGLLESAYEAAMKYLLEQCGNKVESQVYLPIYWDNVKLDKSYRMDLVINENNLFSEWYYFDIVEDTIDKIRLF